MKDIIENRTRTSSRTKLRLLTLSLRENGPLWTGLMAIYYVASAIAEKSFAAANKLRQSTSLPGVNSLRMNREIWNNWDWSAAGGGMDALTRVEGIYRYAHSAAECS